MAGRPRTMAKRVRHLYERYTALRDELQQLMPQQYQRAGTDSLGHAWQTAVSSLWSIDDYLMDLVSELDWKAKKAEERTAARAEANAVLMEQTAMAEPAAGIS